jgi:raffinose/stachyose/melibiose transport system permease protein
MYVPAVIVIFVFIIYPLIRGVWISFTDWNGYSQSYSWIGLDNYRRMFTDANMYVVATNSIIYGIGSTVFQNILGLAYALLLNKKIKTRGFARTIIYLPVIVSPLIMGYIFYFILQYNGGALNDVILLFTDQPVNVLNSVKWNVWVITFINANQNVGICMVIYLAGLQTISKEYYEASRIDGASTVAQFKHVTLPLLAPSTTIAVVYNLIGAMKIFDIIIALTGGGPGYASSSLNTFMYDLYFSLEDAGYAAAVGNLMFVIIAIIGISILYGLRRREIQ